MVEVKTENASLSYASWGNWAHSFLSLVFYVRIGNLKTVGYI